MFLLLISFYLFNYFFFFISRTDYSSKYSYIVRNALAILPSNRSLILDVASMSRCSNFLFFREVGFARASRPP